MNRGPLLLSLLCLACGAVHAEDLLAVYDRALFNDPQLREAEATRKATLEDKPQALANLLPQLSANAGRSRTWSDGTASTPFLFGPQLTSINTGGLSVTTANTWSFNLRQNVFSWANWTNLKAASDTVAQAEANYLVARQDLAQRVATQYFAVLAAEDFLDAQEVAREAFARELDQAEKRFEVGLIAITDVQESRAARDSAAAAVIAAKRALSNTEQQLWTIVGENYKVLSKPAESMPLMTPNPASEDEWVKVSMEQNATLLSSRLAADIARDQVSNAFGGHLPTLDLTASRSHTGSNGAQDYPGNITGLSTANTYGKSVSLQLTLPIYSGGATQSRVRQAQYQWIAAKERLERSSRETERATRDAYQSVISGIAQVQALRQALESSETALKATQAGYEVGTRTAVEVLDSRRLLIAAQTSYSQGRYAYLNALVALRLASGDLDRSTLEEMNTWLTLAVPAPSTDPATPAP
jgi:outer membrane protein